MMMRREPTKGGSWKYWNSKGEEVDKNYRTAEESNE